MAEVMFDSCGIFTLCSQRKMNRFLNLEDTQGSEKLVHFAQGQGYPIKCYLGGTSALEQSLERLPEMKRASEVSEHDPATHTKSKLLDPEKWDPLKKLFKGGGHMPLLAYLGNTSGRSDEALQRREANAQLRGWGPTPGGKRSSMMQKQGKGPAPSASAAAEWSKGQNSRDTWWRSNNWSNTWRSGW